MDGFEVYIWSPRRIYHSRVDLIEMRWYVETIVILLMEIT
jgi:hypothetical protein